MSTMLSDLADEDATLSDRWLQLLLDSASDRCDFDITTTAEWGESLRAVHLGGQSARVFLNYTNGELVGVFPYFRKVSRVRGIPCRQLHALSQLYSGRNRLLTKNPFDFAECLVATLLAEEPAWDWLCLTLVDESDSYIAVKAVAERHGCTVETVSLTESPYIDLPDSWESYFETLPKKFRWLLRTSRKKLMDLGALEHHVYTAPNDVGALLDAMFQIEKASWKEGSGSSITLNDTQQAFYETFAVAAARRDWLRGHVLTLDSEPIAYIFGVRLGPVFHDLKESYKLSVREHSPGHVLKTFALPTIIAEGITCYDFRGKCDDYKMKWAAASYRRRDLIIHATTIRARLLRGIGAARMRFRGMDFER